METIAEDQENEYELGELQKKKNVYIWFGFGGN